MAFHTHLLGEHQKDGCHILLSACNPWPTGQRALVHDGLLQTGHHHGSVVAHTGLQHCVKGWVVGSSQQQFERTDEMVDAGANEDEVILEGDERGMGM